MAKEKLNYGELAQIIVENVGGKENVNGVRHCITRVRFRLKDESRANDEILKATKGVISIVKGGGEYMVVIGNEVEGVYMAVCDVLGVQATDVVPETKENDKKSNVVMRVINLIMSAVYPVLNMICAGGVIKGLLSLLSVLGWISAESGFYMVLNGMGDAIFFFLPLILGYNFAKKLSGDGHLGFLIGAIMCYPALQGVDITLLGFTVNSTYTSSFLPVVLVVALAMPIQKFLNKYIHKAISGFLVPVLTLLIVIPLGFLVVGPAATLLGNGVNAVINGLMNAVPLLGGLIFGGLYQVLVLFGIHSAVTSFAFMNVLSGNPDPIMCISCYCSFAQIGVVLAMYLRTKNESLKEVALPAFLSGVFGITEPAIYGVTLPRMKYFVISCIGGAIGGAFCMVTGMLMYSFTGLGVMTILGMVNPANPNFILPILAAVVPFVASFIIAFVIYRDEK